MTTEKSRQLPWGLNPENITPGSMKVANLNNHLNSHSNPTSAVNSKYFFMW